MNNIDIQAIIEKVKNSLSSIGDDMVLPHFQKLEYRADLNKRRIKSVKVSSISDLTKIPSQPGFYVIFSDISKEENMCKAVFKHDKNLKAIYRGEAYDVNIRVKSHLFNNLYEKEFKESIKSKKAKKTNLYSSTLLIDNQKVNIEQEPFKDYKWYVVYHAVPNSTQNVWRMYEDAFDKVFDKPLHSII